MIYSISVSGFDNDNTYQHDSDLIKAKSLDFVMTFQILNGMI